MTVRERALGSRYVLDRELGSGAMGTVWSARDLVTDEAVAAKILHSHFSADVGIVTRFLQERTFLTQLNHPSIVKVRDLVVEGSSLGIVMDLVEGSDLRAVLRQEGTLAPARAAALTADVLDGLAHAHAMSVLHRDVKPDNVLLDGGTRARLSDFSIARLAQETTVRMTGVLGTADYMAPEVFAEQVSAASDVYGTGIMLYELLAGRTPFSSGVGGNSYAIAKRHEVALPPVVPGMPDRLWALLSTLLAKTPAHRPSAAEASAELRRLLSELGHVPPLPAQAAPAVWEELAGESRTGTVSLRSADLTAFEGDDTLIGQRTAPAKQQLPVAGPPPEEPAIAVEDAPLTSIGQRLVARPLLDVPELDVAPAEAAPRPVWMKIAAGAVAVVALVGTVVGIRAITGGSRGDSRTNKTSGSDLVSVQGTPEAPRTGLNIARQYTYDTKAQRVTVDVTWSSGSVLAGPFLESVPALKDADPCPTVTWEDPITAGPATVDGLDAAACGQQVSIGRLGQGAPPRATYGFPAKLNGDISSALSAYAARAGALQRRALAGLGTSPVYPAQRLDGLRIMVTSAVEGSGMAVTVYPVWISEGSSPVEDTLNVLFVTPEGPQSLLDQLGGARALILRTPGCDDNITIGARSIKATSSRDSCTIEGQLGAAVTGSSNTFSILSRTQ